MIKIGISIIQTILCYFLEQSKRGSMLIDLDCLRCFDAVGTALSFRAAAERLAVSPSVVSFRIRQLEDEVGEKLLHRSTRFVQLTPAGERLLPHAHKLLEANSQCRQVARGLPEHAPIELLVGTRFELGLSWLVPALPRLEAASPWRTLHLHFGDGPDLLARLRQGRIDCALTSSRIAEGSLDFRVLHTERYVFAGSTRLVNERPLRNPADARRHTLIDIDDNLPLCRYFLDQAGGSADWKFARVEHLGTVGAVRLRVLQGRGIAVLPLHSVANDLKRGRLRQLMPRVALQSEGFRLLWLRRHPQAHSIAALAAELTQIPMR
jgi:LysR family transcriptional regulator, glycine cleavage system transcriptional activator